MPWHSPCPAAPHPHRGHGELQRGHGRHPASIGYRPRGVLPRRTRGAAPRDGWVGFVGAASPVPRRGAAGSAACSLGINPHPAAGRPLQPASAGASGGVLRLHWEVGWGRAFRKKKEKGEGGSIIIFSNGSRLLGAFKVPFVLPRVRLGRARPGAARRRPPLSACLWSRLLAGIRRPRTSDLRCGWWEK